MLDIGKIIGGPNDGDGLFGLLFNAPAGVLPLAGIAGAGSAGGLAEAGGFEAWFGAAEFASSTSHAAPAGFEAAASAFGRGAAASEGMFARFFTHLNATDAAFWLDFLTNGAPRRAWGALTDTVKQTALAHGTLLRQLREHLPDHALTREYEALGTALPGADFLKKVKAGLVGKVHADRSGDSALHSAFNSAIDLLGNQNNCAEYELALGSHRKAVEQILEDVLGAKAPKPAVRPIAGLIGCSEQAAQKAAEAQKSWFSKLGKGQKIGLGIAAGAAVAVGAYYIYHQMTRQPTDHPNSHHDLLIGGGKSHADKIRRSQRSNTHQTVA